MHPQKEQPKSQTTREMSGNGRHNRAVCAEWEIKWLLIKYHMPGRIVYKVINIRVQECCRSTEKLFMRLNINHFILTFTANVKMQNLDERGLNAEHMKLKSSLAY